MAQGEVGAVISFLKSLLGKKDVPKEQKVPSSQRMIRINVECVYVNQDGTVRELSPDEKKYLSQEFIPGDGAMPYIKPSYESRDGWGSLSGFFPRAKVPSGLQIQPVNPDYKPVPVSPQQLIEDHVAAGYVVKKSSDRSVTVTLDPNRSKGETLEAFRQLQLKRQAESERSARHPDYS